MDGTVCGGPLKNEKRCNPNKLPEIASQEAIFQTLSYDVFAQGHRSYCVPFVLYIGKIEDDLRLGVYTYYWCNYDLVGVDETTCRQCMHQRIKKLRDGKCRNSTGGVSVNDICCVRYELFNMCTNDTDHGSHDTLNLGPEPDRLV
ncbi:hypothetical protein LINPERPRIM_LOCUS39729 [Linum perenne]